MSMAVMVVLVVFIEGFLHYFPWRVILKRELHRVAAYVLGVLGMMLPFSAWLWLQELQNELVVLWLVLGASGMTVVILYAIDDWVKNKRDAEDACEREKAALNVAKEVMDGKSE